MQKNKFNIITSDRARAWAGSLEDPAVVGSSAYRLVYDLVISIADDADESDPEGTETFGLMLASLEELVERAQATKKALVRKVFFLD